MFHHYPFFCSDYSLPMVIRKALATNRQFRIIAIRWSPQSTWQEAPSDDLKLVGIVYTSPKSQKRSRSKWQAISGQGSCPPVHSCWLTALFLRQTAGTVPMVPQTKNRPFVCANRVNHRNGSWPCVVCWGYVGARPLFSYNNLTT